nr:hypothetical protein [Tanacetum cinerariifolium]
TGAGAATVDPTKPPRLAAELADRAPEPAASRNEHPDSKDDLETLLKLAAGAISRLQSHQLGGLEQTRTNADGTQVTTWQLEIPMRNAHDIVPLQVRVQREDTPEREDAAET